MKKINCNNEHVIFLAVNEQKIVGLIHGCVNDLLLMEPYIRIGALVVDEKYRHQGVGRKLLLATENWAQEQNINWVGLSSNVDRIESHKFYENKGYKCLKQQKLFKKILKI